MFPFLQTLEFQLRGARTACFMCAAVIMFSFACLLAVFKSGEECWRMPALTCLNPAVIVEVRCLRRDLPHLVIPCPLSRNDPRNWGYAPVDTRVPCAKTWSRSFLLPRLCPLICGSYSVKFQESILLDPLDSLWTCCLRLLVILRSDC